MSERALRTPFKTRSSDLGDGWPEMTTLARHRRATILLTAEEPTQAARLLREVRASLPHPYLDAGKVHLDYAMDRDALAVGDRFNDLRKTASETVKETARRFSGNEDGRCREGRVRPGRDW